MLPVVACPFGGGGTPSCPGHGVPQDRDPSAWELGTLCLGLESPGLGLGTPAWDKDSLLPGTGLAPPGTGVPPPRTWGTPT